MPALEQHPIATGERGQRNAVLAVAQRVSRREDDHQFLLAERLQRARPAPGPRPDPEVGAALGDRLGQRRAVAVFVQPHRARWVPRPPAAQHWREQADRDGPDGRDLELPRLQPEDHARRAPRARSVAASAARAAGSSASPAGVGRTPRGSRSTSAPPTSASSARICCESVGCDT